MSPTEVIDLGSSDDEESPVKAKGVIDLTIESSDDEDGLPDISKALNAANAAVAAKAAVPPPLNGTPTVPRPQVPRQQSPIEDPSSHSDSSPVKRKPRKKRLLNNQEPEIPIPPTPSPRKARVSHAKRASIAINPIEEEEPIKRPSHYGTKGLKVMRRFADGTKNSRESSAPKTNAGTRKQATTVHTEKAPKKKIATVKNVLNASLESLVPAAPRTETTISTDSHYPNDDPPQEDNFPEYEMDPVSPAQAPPQSPPPPPSPPAPRRNPDYQPYSPEAASRGAGPSSRTDWYVNLAPAGWHSQSAAAYPYLPPLRPPLCRPSKPVPFVPSTESGPLSPLKIQKSRKRTRTVLSDEESDDRRPPSPKKRKYSIADDGDDDGDLSINLDRILKSVVTNAQQGDQVETTDATEQGTGETEEEVDQLIESAFEDDPEPLQFDQPASPPSAHVEEDSERPGFFDNGDPDTQMEASGSKRGDVLQDSNEHDFPDGNEADLEDSANQRSNSARLQRPLFLTRDPEEEKLKRLLDSYSDILEKYPSYVKGCSRPGLSPKDAPWVILRPFLERKLELERKKLQKRQNDSS